MILDSLALARTAYQAMVRSPALQDGTPAHSGTDIVKQGLMTKQGGGYKTWKLRWFVLTPVSLAYYKDRDDDPIDRIILSTIDKVEDAFIKTNIHNSLAVGTPSRTYYMFTESPQDRDDWLIELRKYVRLAKARF